MKNLKKHLGAAILGGGILANLASPTVAQAQGTMITVSGPVTGYQFDDGSATLHGVNMNNATLTLSVQITNSMSSLTPTTYVREPASFTTFLSDGTHSWSQSITNGQFSIQSGGSQVNWTAAEPGQFIGLGLTGDYPTFASFGLGSANNSGLQWNLLDIGHGNGAGGAVGVGPNAMITVSEVPEPCSLALLGLGAAAFGLSRRKKPSEVGLS